MTWRFELVDVLEARLHEGREDLGRVVVVCVRERLERLKKRCYDLDDWRKEEECSKGEEHWDHGQGGPIHDLLAIDTGVRH